jgi:hypothetical protein
MSFERNDRVIGTDQPTPLGDLFSVSRGLQLHDWVLRLALGLPNCCLIPSTPQPQQPSQAFELPRSYCIPGSCLSAPGSLLGGGRSGSAAEAFRYVDIESSDWCRALRLVKLIFISDLHCFSSGPVNHDQDEAVGSQGPRGGCRGRQGVFRPVLVGGEGKGGTVTLS